MSRLPRSDSDPVPGRLFDPNRGHFPISSPTGSAQVKTTWRRYQPIRICRRLKSPPRKGTASRSRTSARTSSSTVATILPNSPQDATYDVLMAQAAILPLSEPRRLRIDDKTDRAGISCADRRKGCGFYFRYLRSEEFGRLKSRFVICSFWPQAPTRLDRLAEARQSMAQVPTWASLFNAAVAVGRPWTTVLYLAFGDRTRCNGIGL